MADTVKFSALPVDTNPPASADIFATVNLGVSKQITALAAGIAGLTNKSILIGNSSGNIAQSANFTYDSGTGVLTSNGKTVLFGNNFSNEGILKFLGAFEADLTFTGPTTVTFPTSGTLATTASLSGYVPYTGATSDVVLGSHGLTVGSASSPPSLGIISSGSVYIGATSSQSSAAKLQTTNTGWNYSGSDGTVAGGIYINSATTNAPVMFGSYTNTNIGFFTNNGNASMTIAATTGNVSIGAASAAEKLDVTGAIRSLAALAGTTSASLSLDYGSASSVGRILAFGTNTSTNGILRFLSLRSNASNAVTMMSLDSNGVCIGGTYAASITAPANGLVIQGLVGIGITSSLQYQLNIDAASTSSGIGLYNTGAIKWSMIDFFSDDTFRIGDASAYRLQIAQGGNIAIGTNLSPTSQIQLYLSRALAGTTGSLTGFQIQSTFGASSGTVGDAECIYLIPNFSTNVGTITQAAGIIIAAGSTAGTVTTGYGLLVNPIAYGTNRYGLYVLRPSATGATNYYAAYLDPTVGIGATPASNSALNIGASGLGYGTYISGTCTFSALVIGATVSTNTAAVNPIGINNSVTITTSAATTTAYGLYNAPTYLQTGGGTYASVAGCYIYMVLGNTVIGTSYGLRIDTGSGGSITTNSYALFVQRPAVGASNRYTAYFDPVVGIGDTPALTTILKVAGTDTTMCYGLSVIPTITATDTLTGSGGQRGITIVPFFAPVTPILGSSCISAVIGGNFAAVGGGAIANAYGIYLSNSYTSNTGAVTTYTGIFYDGGAAAVGTVGTSFGMYITRPVAGSSRFTAYFDPVVGIGATPDSGTVLRLSGTSGQYYGLLMDGILTGVSATVQVGIYGNYSLTPGSATSASYGIALTPTMNTANATVGTYFGIYLSFSKSGANALSTAYSIYSSAPAGATDNYNIVANAGNVASLRNNISSIGTIQTNDASALSITNIFTTAPANSSNLYTVFLNPQWVGTSTRTVGSTFGVYIKNDFSIWAGGTVSFAYGMYIDAGTANAGTVNEAYGLHVSTPIHGTNKWCANFTGNSAFFASGTFAQTFGGGINVIALGNRNTAPTSNPVGGGILYAASGAGTWRGSSGTITTFGPADPHCPECGSDFGFEWDNEKYGGNLRICAVCLSQDLGAKPYIRWNEKSDHIH